MIYKRHFVRICSVNPSNFTSIILIIRVCTLGIYLLSRDDSKTTKDNNTRKFKNTNANNKQTL